MEAGQIPVSKVAARGHQRHNSSQRSTPRRSTKGPLDLGDDPLSTPSTPPVSNPPKVASPALSNPLASPTSLSSSRSMTSPPPSSTAEIPPSHLAPLTRPGNFRPLPPSVTPLTFPPPTTPLSELLSAGQFRAAALLSARQLAAPPSSQAPLQASQILELWHIRLAALSLLGFEDIASDEARALGDVVDGEVYRSPVDGESIVPWGLRVLAIRLQARAEGDLSRGVIGMHVLAREARRRASGPDVDATARQLWSGRLADLRIRVVSLLVEVGDLDGAARLLEGMKTNWERMAIDERSLLDSRLLLLYLHIGNIERATDILAKAETRGDALAPLLKPLLAASEGSYEFDEATADNDAVAHNQAVGKLYSGDLEGAKHMLSQAAETGLRFPALLFNLTTMFELSTNNARELKIELGKSLTAKGSGALGVEYNGADLKL